MENRFKLLREEEEERRKDINPKAKFGQKEFCEELEKKCGFYITVSKLKKLETGKPDAKIDKELLLAYKKFFGVSTDWLIDNAVRTRHLTGDTASASAVTGLSDESIEKIAQLNDEHKIILDKMISKYGFLCVLSEIRNLLGYNYLKPHLTLQFDEKRRWLNGAEIDQFLNNAINDENVSIFFNETVNQSIKQIINNTMNDNDLLKHFGELDKHSKLKTGPLPAKLLPKLGNPEDEGSDKNETT